MSSHRRQSVIALSPHHVITSSLSISTNHPSSSSYVCQYGGGGTSCPSLDSARGIQWRLRLGRRSCQFVKDASIGDLEGGRSDERSKGQFTPSPTAAHQSRPQQNSRPTAAFSTGRSISHPQLRFAPSPRSHGKVGRHLSGGGLGAPASIHGMEVIHFERRRTQRCPASVQGGNLKPF